MARPLARRNSASLVLSAGYRPGSASQTRAACRVAASWTPRYSSARSSPLARHWAVSSASWPYRIMLVSSSSSHPRSRGHACSRTSCAISARSASSTSRRQRANASRTALDLGPLALGPPGAQVAAGRRPADGPAVRAHGRHPPEHLPRDRLLVLGQAAVGRLGGDLDGPGDPGLVTRVLVASPGQLVAVAALPGQHHGLGEQRKDPRPGAAVGSACGRAQVGQDGVDQVRLDGQPARLGRPGDHAAQVGVGHRADDDLVVAAWPAPARGSRRTGPSSRRVPRSPTSAGGSPAGPAGLVAAAHTASMNAARSLRPFLAGREDLLELVDDQDQPDGPAAWTISLISR